MPSTGSRAAWLPGTQTFGVEASWKDKAFRLLQGRPSVNRTVNTVHRVPPGVLMSWKQWHPGAPKVCSVRGTCPDCGPGMGLQSGCVRCHSLRTPRVEGFPLLEFPESLNPTQNLHPWAPPSSRPRSQELNTWNTTHILTALGWATAPLPTWLLGSLTHCSWDVPTGRRHPRQLVLNVPVGTAS